MKVYYVLSTGALNTGDTKMNFLPLIHLLSGEERDRQICYHYNNIYKSAYHGPKFLEIFNTLSLILTILYLHMKTGRLREFK